MKRTFTLLILLSLPACEDPKPEPYDENLPETGFAPDAFDYETDTDVGDESSTGDTE